MLLMTAMSTFVTGSALTQMQDLTATVSPSQSSLDACLTAIDITDCRSGAINGSLDFGIDQSTGDVKIDNFNHFGKTIFGSKCNFSGLQQIRC